MAYHPLYQDIVDEMDEIAPMLAKMGYDPDANPPNYGVPDGIVANNTKEVRFALISNKVYFHSQVHEHGKEWEIRSKQLINQMRKAPNKQ